MTLSEFHGRHILITGGSTGIGLATAQLLARRGARVFLLARNQANLSEATQSIAQAGGTAAHRAVDVSNREELLAAIEVAEHTFGPVEGLFANAGMGGFSVSSVQRRNSELATVAR